MKAVNRRIEALLTSVDPIAVKGNHIVLVSAYEFHRDKLNTDDVRSVVEDAITRLVGRTVRVECQLRGEAPLAPVAESGASAASQGVPPSPPSSAEPSPSGPPGVAPLVAVDGDADERRLRAAKNIFDAEEVELDEAVSTDA